MDFFIDPCNISLELRTIATHNITLTTIYAVVLGAMRSAYLMKRALKGGLSVKI